MAKRRMLKDRRKVEKLGEDVVKEVDRETTIPGIGRMMDVDLSVVEANIDGKIHRLKICEDCFEVRSQRRKHQHFVSDPLLKMAYSVYMDNLTKIHGDIFRRMLEQEGQEDGGLK